MDPSGEEEKNIQNQEQFLSTGDKALLSVTGIFLTAGRWLSAGVKVVGGKLLGGVGFAYDILRPEGYANANEADLLKQCGSGCFGGIDISTGVMAGALSNANVSKKVITLSPSELVPTETPEAWKIQKLERSMMRSGQFFSEHPVEFFENNGVKYIVDGHHRTQAAKNLGITVKATEVNESYLMKRFGGTAADFMEKAFRFLGKIK